MSQLARVRIFENLPEATLQRLEQAALALEPRNGAEIFVQDDLTDSLYAIVAGEGRVRITAANRNSKRLMVEVFSAGDVFGEIGIIDGGTRTATAVVDGRVRLLRISQAGFLAALAETPALGLNLARLLSQRLRRTFELLQDATFETVEVRLARQVLYLGELHGRATEAGTVLNTRLRQHDLADLLGITTRSVITVLNAWRASGLVHYDADRALVTIANEPGLRQLITD